MAVALATAQQAVTATATANKICGNNQPAATAIDIRCCASVGKTQPAVVLATAPAKHVVPEKSSNQLAESKQQQQVYRGDGNSIGISGDGADYSGCSAASGDCYSKPARGVTI